MEYVFITMRVPIPSSGWFVVNLKHKQHTIVEINHNIHTQSIDITTCFPDVAYYFVSYYCIYMDIVAWVMGNYSQFKVV